MSRNPFTKKAPRVKGVSIYRPFVYGSLATPLPLPRPLGTPPDHTHRWTVFVRPTTPNFDITHWLRKVQFKLHETYSQSLRTVESPPFEVTETGWGEFEVGIKLFFVPEASEKPLSVYHQLKLHPYIGTDEEKDKVRRDGGEVGSKCYEEVCFNEPVEVFYEILTQGNGREKEKGKGKGKAKSLGARGGGGDKPTERSAEIPNDGKPYSHMMEAREIDRLTEAVKQVNSRLAEERAKLAEREKLLEELKKETASGLGR
ncbi:NuA4 histone H4 acetyltransferase complex and the SWR1 complex subunit [Lambiella insularis]|nr:NuA4 histone H4 acetyltransferase complex and the SWR1 complex subunit [Lambiella insularis]